MTEHSSSSQVNRSLQLLWDMSEQPNRGPKRGLSLEQVVAAAVEVADKDGLDAVSMRRVATVLDIGTMSLYRYVPGKAELVDLMLDYVESCVDDDVLANLTWREHIVTWARGAFQLYLAHPWLLKVDRSRPLLGPNALTGFEQLIRGLRDTGLADQEKVAVVSTIDAFITGFTRSYVNSIEAEERTGLSEGEFWAAQAPVLEKAMGTGNYPMLATMAEDSFNMSYEDNFEFGLQRLLDGLAELVTIRQNASPADA